MKLASRTLLTLWILVSPQGALASSYTCNFYKKFIPSLADKVCNGVGGGRGPASRKGASAGSSFSAAFNLTPAAAPTEPTPWGLENIQSQIRAGTGQITGSIALVKGFTRFGTAVSTASNNTFYGNDVGLRGAGLVESSTSSIPSLNLGTAFALNPKAKGTFRAVSLGVSARYNAITETLGPGLGLSVGEDWITLGVGLSREKVSTTLPAIVFGSAMIGIKLFILEFEQVWLQNYGGPSLEAIPICTVTLNLGRLYITAARRTVSTSVGGFSDQNHYALQAKISRHLALGVLHNFIPGTNSVAFQLFL